MDDQTYSCMQRLVLWESESRDAILAVRSDGRQARTEIAMEEGCYPLHVDEPQIRAMAVRILKCDRRRPLYGPLSPRRQG